ncbi:hypothetical protein [Nakamurella deserti]|uniref:hypothetical protein n=1 Tax=Nakamurella deserti TaxID=2164074 RepID=UPI001F0C64F9|nr:hypothetical protein [Nakamurella deserti]
MSEVITTEEITTTTNQLSNLSSGAIATAIIIGSVVFVIMLIAYTNVIARAGYSRVWILIMLVPIANIVFLLIFCFKEWPVQRELAALRSRVGHQPAQQY